MTDKERKTMHLCVSSHDEVMFRCHEDYARAFNCFANAVFSTESRALADGFMSNHYHLCVQTYDYEDLLYRMRYSYTRYFNTKYHRKGRLGEKNPFTTEVDGIRHVTTCLSYIYRQALHHGAASTPFEYPYNSVNAIFQKQLGKASPVILMPDAQRYQYLPSHSSIPDSVRMDSTGQLLREDVIDYKYVQEIFISPKNFLFYMTRNSDENWINEQKDDAKGAPITLPMFEESVTKDSDSLFRNERGRIDYSHIGDLQLCELIDKQYVPQILKGNRDEKSIYIIPESKRRNLADQIRSDLRKLSGKQNRKLYVTDEQLKRCLII